MNQEGDSTAKLVQLINKNRELLDEKKYYQFSQKIKLLSHRKIQMKKYDYAETLLLLGIKQLYAIHEVEEVIPLELIQQLVDLYKNHLKAFPSTSQKTFLESTVKLRELSLSLANILFDLVKIFNKPKEMKEITNLVVDFYMERKEFYLVESIVGFLGDEKIRVFLNLWTESEGIKPDEVPAIWCRTILMQGLIYDIKKAKQFFEQAPEPKAHPYYTFTEYLLTASTLQSKEAFRTLEQSYGKFLNTDQKFKTITSMYGEIYLGINKKQKGGLEGLLSGIMG